MSIWLNRAESRDCVSTFLMIIAAILREQWHREEEDDEDDEEALTCPSDHLWK